MAQLETGHVYSKREIGHERVVTHAYTEYGRKKDAESFRRLEAVMYPKGVIVRGLMHIFHPNPR